MNRKTFAFVAALGAIGCGSSSSDESGAPKQSKIKHVVLLVKENHTFDSYFGKYCTAPAGSNPTCTSGRNCCEAAPATEPSGAQPTVLDDASNLATDRNHTRECEGTQIDGGK